MISAVAERQEAVQCVCSYCNDPVSSSWVQTHFLGAGQDENSTWCSTQCKRELNLRHGALMGVHLNKVKHLPALGGQQGGGLAVA
ncbi:MAG: hypothetical protein NTZ87_00755 [Candidatus Nomurabacteria bacterium]|nr:hypothetical protein [Candidatus Nomurabacteria bacterium]